MMNWESQYRRAKAKAVYNGLFCSRAESRLNLDGSNVGG